MLPLQSSCRLSSQPAVKIDCNDRTDFIITTSVDGHLKLWKKQDVGIEFVKDFRAHVDAVVAASVSADGKLFSTMSEDGSVKIFDVVNFGAQAYMVHREVMN